MERMKSRSKRLSQQDIKVTVLHTCSVFFFFLRTEEAIFRRHGRFDKPPRFEMKQTRLDPERHCLCFDEQMLNLL